MFREIKKTTPSPKFFGVGSLIKEPSNDYLVILPFVGSVQLMKLKTFELIGKPVKVEDTDCISKSECATLVSCLEYAFSDYDYDPKGLKK